MLQVVADLLSTVLDERNAPAFAATSKVIMLLKICNVITLCSSLGTSDMPIVSIHERNTCIVKSHPELMLKLKFHICLRTLLASGNFHDNIIYMYLYTIIAEWLI